MMLIQTGRQYNEKTMTSVTSKHNAKNHNAWVACMWNKFSVCKHAECRFIAAWIPTDSGLVAALLLLILGWKVDHVNAIRVKLHESVTASTRCQVNKVRNLF